MKIYRHITEIPAESRHVVTIGTFDGVHAGHRKILSRVKQLAEEQNAQSLVMTFDPHPRKVLQPDMGITLLTNTEEKLKLFDELGIDAVFIQKFDEAFANTSAQDYIEKILVKGLKTKGLVIGYDHHFGKGRTGSLRDLIEKSMEFDYVVEEISAQDIDDVVVSSTKIRNALKVGDVAKAAEYLTYPYSLQAKVIEGRKLGRTIGFPTANLEFTDSEKLIPNTGVYAVKALVDQQTYLGMMNIGYRPTVDNDKQLKAEVHMLQFNQDIYDKLLCILFIERVRDELKFDSVHKLAEQLHSDKRTVETIFGL
ncbi:MAG: bifunctional riboflavin kinase/FAD synthetase [Flavobacteriales bacterium]